MFIRFVVGADDEDHRLLTGVITEARFLRDRNELEEDQVVWLEETYSWLNEHLPCPPFSTAGWSRDAVTWFKDNAEDPIKRMWEIAVLLREHGVPVRLLRSKNPGKVLYEDDYQVVVEEWKHV